MCRKYIYTAVAVISIGGALNAQSFQRRANITGGGSPDQGKCTVEVVVDGAVEVEIRGDSANLRNLSGQPPQWRRFECTSPMPPNPAEFRFAGLDGRGKQQLVRDPRNGGSAVVRIEDRDNGSEGYTFDILWGGGGRNYTQGGPPVRDDRGFGPPPRGDDRGFGPPPRDDRDFDRDRDRDRGFGDRRFTTDQAIRVCEDWVREEANRRLGTGRIDFQRTAMDDNPGRNDWVIGTFAAPRRFGRPDYYRFSCSVNFDNGRVRSADFRPER
jgi:hypothetical protein